MTLLTRW